MNVVINLLSMSRHSLICQTFLLNKWSYLSNIPATRDYYVMDCQMSLLVYYGWRLLGEGLVDSSLDSANCRYDIYSK